MTTYATVTGDLLNDIGTIVSHYRAQDKWLEYTRTRLTKAGAGVFTRQHGIFTRHSRRAWAYVVGNCSEVEIRRFIVKENLYEEEGVVELSHYLKLVRMANDLGVSTAEMENAEPLSSTRAALLIWEFLTKDKHWLIGAAAKAALEYRTTSGEEGQKWMKDLGLSRDQADFHLMHHEADKVHSGGTFELLLKYLPAYKNEVSEKEILDAVDASMYAYITMFRAGMAEAALAVS
jgi:pyrroloquinoline quinone (PQQ) biosynthesis protein C